MAADLARTFDASSFEHLQQAARRVFARRPDVIAVYLHGSAARGEPAHDLDIAVLSQGALSHTVLEDLATELRVEGAPTRPELDMRALNGTSPRFRFEVLRHGQLLYESDPGRRIEFEGRAASEWADFKPTWERMKNKMFDRWARG